MRAIKNYERYRQRTVRAALRVLPSFSDEDWARFVRDIERARSLQRVYAPQIKQMLEQNTKIFELFR